jgi:hypothetical protein
VIWQASAPGTGARGRRWQWHWQASRIHISAHIDLEDTDMRYEIP